MILQHHKLSLLLFFALVSSSVRAQTMYVRTNSQGISSYPIETIGKLTFPSGNLLVTNTTGSNATIGLSDVRKITFNAALGTTQQQASPSSAFYLYPNPTGNEVHIGSRDEALLASEISVVSIEGRLLLQQNQQDSAGTIDVSALPSGLYLCKITSGSQTQTIKFLKQ